MSNNQDFISINLMVLEVTARSSSREDNADFSIRMYGRNIETGKAGYVRLKTRFPPCPGDMVRVEGNKVNNAKLGTLISAKNVQVLRNGSGLLYYAMKTVLDAYRVTVDRTSLMKACGGLRVGDIDEETFIGILKSAGVPEVKIGNISQQYAAGFFSSVFFRSLQRIDLGSIFDHATASDLPFAPGVWPADILAGCLLNPVKVSLGQQVHPFATSDGKRFNVTQYLSFEFIDSFFLALSHMQGSPTIFNEWLSSGLRPAVVTNRYVLDKRSSGAEVLMLSDLMDLYSLGISSAESMLANSGAFFAVEHAGSHAFISQGTHQQLGALFGTATGSEYKHTKPYKDVKIDWLDEMQNKAANAILDPSKRLVCISGVPGGGKTTIVANAVRMGLDSGLFDSKSLLLLAPTGKAAARITEVLAEVGVDLKGRTVHSQFYGGYRHVDTKKLRPLLEGEVNNAAPIDVERIIKYRTTSTKVSTNPAGVEIRETTSRSLSDVIDSMLIQGISFKGKTVLVDESSQLTLDMISALLSLQPDKLILSGDYQQLESIGLGDPFHDLIKLGRSGGFGSGAVLVELTRDYRAQHQLAGVTADLRNHKIPVDEALKLSEVGVERIVNDSKSPFLLIEADKKGDVSELVESMVGRAVYQSPLCGEGREVGKGGYSLVWPGQGLFRAKQFKFLDTMLLASKNSTVRRLNQVAETLLDKSLKYELYIDRHPLLAPLASSGVKIGSIVMQRQNEKNALTYKVGRYTFNKDPELMNGDMGVVLGIGVAFPVPSTITEAATRAECEEIWRAAGFDIDEVAYAHEALGSPDDPKYVESLLALHKEYYLQIVRRENQEGVARLLGVAMAQLWVARHADFSSALATGEPLDRFVVYPVLPTHPLESTLGRVVSEGFPITIKDEAVNESQWKNCAEAINRDVYELTSGAAFTVHRAQGSQAKNVLMVVDMPPRAVAGKKSGIESLFYTGVTRAQEKARVILLGMSAHKLQLMCSSERAVREKRLSTFSMMMRGDLPFAISTHQMMTTQLPGGSLPRLGEEAAPEPTGFERWGGFHERSLAAAVGVPSDTARISSRLNAPTVWPLSLDTELSNVIETSYRKRYADEKAKIAEAAKALPSTPGQPPQQNPVDMNKVWNNYTPTMLSNASRKNGQLTQASIEKGVRFVVDVPSIEMHAEEVEHSATDVEVATHTKQGGDVELDIHLADMISF